MGILTVNADGADLRKQLIREAVAAYKRIYPSYYQQTSKAAKEMRNTRATEFGSDRQLELRMCLRLPSGLFTALNELIHEPEIFHEKKELEWFMREYPEFCVPQKI